MIDHLDAAFILSFVDILKGNQVDTGAVSKSLELICTNTCFDSGLIYEVDHLDQFCLMEHVALDNALLCDCFVLHDYTLEQQAYLVRKPFCYMERGTQNEPIEMCLLDICAATSLIAAPVMDEDYRMYGLVILSNTKAKSAVLDAEMQILSALLSILVRYVGVRMYRNKLTQARISLENILDNTGIDIYVNDFNNHDILYVNKSMAAPYGGFDAFLGKKCWDILFPGQTAPCAFCPQMKLIDEQGAPTKVYSWDYQRPFDGSWFRVFSAAFYWVDGRLAHVVSSANITDNKRNEALVEYLANYDQLTKLPNRRMLIKDCEKRINNATATEKSYVLFFDIDGFKAINDNSGHDAGDEFLIQLGAFFSNIPLLKDSIYRNGGDEFVAIIGGEGVTKDNIQSLGSFIHERFKKSWKLKKAEIFCNTSIGVSCFPEDGRTVEELLQRADEAMYKVKKSGGRALCFGYQLDSAVFLRS